MDTEVATNPDNGADADADAVVALWERLRGIVEDGVNADVDAAPPLLL